MGAAPARPLLLAAQGSACKGNRDAQPWPCPEEGSRLCRQLPTRRLLAGLCSIGLAVPFDPCADQPACLSLGCSGCGSLFPLVAVQINKVYQQYVKKVQQDVWERDHG